VQANEDKNAASLNSIAERTPSTLAPVDEGGLEDLVTRGPLRRKQALRLTKRQAKVMLEMGLIRVDEEDLIKITALGKWVAQHPE